VEPREAEQLINSGLLKIHDRGLFEGMCARPTCLRVALMGKDEGKFAAIPSRALGDKRLYEAHFRVLGKVALHDGRSSTQGGKGSSAQGGCCGPTRTPWRADIAAQGKCLAVRAGHVVARRQIRHIDSPSFSLKEQ
jgi:hypothetical protein